MPTSCAPRRSFAIARIARPRSGLCHEQRQGGDDDDGRAKTHRFRDGDIGDTQIQGFERIRGLDGERVCAPEEDREILQNDCDAKRDKQDIFIVAMSRSSNDATLQRIANDEQCRNDDERRQVRVDTKKSIQEKDAVERQHQQRAMREVDDVKDPVDERKAQRHQRIYRAHGQAIENRWEQNPEFKH